MKPSSDDFLALHQVDRGEKEGGWTFFKRSDIGDYRPLQNSTFWLFGRWSRTHRLLSLRILHFLGFAFYAVVAFLWIRSLSYSRLGGVAAGCVVFFHPTQAGALAGLDNYARLVASAWVWLGTWIAYNHGGRVRLSVPLVCLCFAFGLGYMEYAIALAPLAVLATAWRGGTRRWLNAGVMFVGLAGVFVVYFLVRLSGVVAGSPGTGLLSLNPLVWARNTVTILVAVMFSGNTVPVMLQRTLPRLVWPGLSVTLAMLALGYGLRAIRSVPLPRSDGDPQTGPPAVATPRAHLGFLLTAFSVSFFPMLLMTHVSEIYLTSVTLGLALLTGLSAHGWIGASPSRGFLALVFASSQLLLAANAIQAKISGINDAGERTDAMMRQLLEHLPNDGSIKKMAIAFLEKEAAGAIGYSVFAMPDDQLIQSGYATYALDWFRPEQGVRLDHLVVKDPSDVDFESYDLVLLWERSNKRFIPIARSPGRP